MTDTPGDGIDYLSESIKTRVEKRLAIPMIELAVKKIQEDWPGRFFTRMSPTAYMLDGFIFTRDNTYKVTLEAGCGGKGLVSVGSPLRRDVNVILDAPLDKEFHKKFPDIIADCIVKLQNHL